MVEIRSARPEDSEAVRRVVGAAFGRDEVPALVDALEASGHARASLVAVDEQVVGHVMLSRSWLDARERLVEVLVLSPLSVEPGRQREGIGTELVAAAIATAETLDAPLLFLEGDPDYYGRRGFARASPLGFDRPSVRIPDPGFQVAVLPSHEAWMRGRMVYCEPFWVLDCVGLRDPRLAAVERRLG